MEYPPSFFDSRQRGDALPQLVCGNAVILQRAGNFVHRLGAEHSDQIDVHRHAEMRHGLHPAGNGMALCPACHFFMPGENIIAVQRNEKRNPRYSPFKMVLDIRDYLCLRFLSHRARGSEFVSRM